MSTLHEHVRRIWNAMSENERAIVRFGMTPAKHAEELEAKGYTCRDIALAFMAEAKAGGGMVV